MVPSVEEVDEHEEDDAEQNSDHNSHQDGEGEANRVRFGCATVRVIPLEVLV